VITEVMDNHQLDVWVSDLVIAQPRKNPGFSYFYSDKFGKTYKMQVSLIENRQKQWIKCL
jgi:hypothetical protein